ncbi:MAG: hypothetical protein AAF355_15555 [Myxococcota bacterium]
MAVKAEDIRGSGLESIGVHSEHEVDAHWNGLGTLWSGCHWEAEPTVDPALSTSPHRTETRLPDWIARLAHRVAI